MRSMGFVISHKNRERRRALLPKDLKKIQGVDMFPHTEGIETVVLLDKGEMNAKKVRVEL